MLDCGHVFCIDCLNICYGEAIKEGNIPAVQCLALGCATERAAAATSLRRKRSKALLRPSELLQLGLAEHVVRRYVTLRYRLELEADKKTVYCPRPGCDGAARSDRHKKPRDLALAFADPDPDSDSDADSDDEGGGDGMMDQGAADAPGADRGMGEMETEAAGVHSVCEDCDFAFCSGCFEPWHGELVDCATRREPPELTDEDKATLEYLELHTSTCPTCNISVQKMGGCNHMLCTRCGTHFCNLCSALLDAENPYRHYSEMVSGQESPCYGRLWQSREGHDELDVHDDGELAADEFDAGELPADEFDAGELPPDAFDAGHPNFLWHLFIGPLPAFWAVPGVEAGPDQPPAVFWPVPLVPADRVEPLAGPEPRQRQRQRQRDDVDLGINPAEAAWVREYVRLALADAEDEMGGLDSDGEEGQTPDSDGEEGQTPDSDGEEE